MFFRTIVFILLSTFIVSGCKSKKQAVSVAEKPAAVVTKPRSQPVVTTPIEETPTVEETVKTEPKPKATYADRVNAYINRYKRIAKEEMLQYGIPASITLAQGILESGAGNGDLTRKANNHFGIKCHREWTGDRVYHDDDELQECFRKYKDPKYSFRDHSLFLTQRSRYRNLFSLRKNDYKAWARGLKKAGYATDPKYPNKLISIIERYNLDKYDSEVLGAEANIVKPDDSKIRTYTVKKGDTLYAIARRFNVTVDILKEYNGLATNDISIGQVLYLHSVKR